MGDRSSIEWCDATYNPITGCTPVSAACDHCYASRQIRSGRTPAVHGSKDFEKVTFHPSRLDIPIRWKKPRRIFICSMGDLFHEQVEHRWIVSIFSHIEAAPWHTFMALTKRPENMLRHFRGGLSEKFPVLPNLWLGVTAENQEMADQRIPILLQTPAAKRFVSVEPMLGPVDLFDNLWTGNARCRQPSGKLNWVICGGESGPGARPLHPDWPRSLRDQCQAAGVPFFFKQWGEWSLEKPPDFHKVTQKRYSHEADTFLPDGARYRSDHPDDYQLPGMETMWRVGKKAAGCLLDGKEWKQFPEVKI